MAVIVPKVRQSAVSGHQFLPRPAGGSGSKSFLLRGNRPCNEMATLRPQQQDGVCNEGNGYVHALFPLYLRSYAFANKFALMEKVPECNIISDGISVFIRLCEDSKQMSTNLFAHAQVIVLL